jgi:ketosteroid isomerase-like protein
MTEATQELELRTAERALYDAMIRKDLVALAELLSSDLAYVHSTGVVESKDEYLAAVKRSLYAYQRIESRNPAIKRYGAAATTRGIVDMWVATDGGAVEQLALQFVLIWETEAGRWRMVHRQTTRIPS